MTPSPTQTLQTLNQEYQLEIQSLKNENQVLMNLIRQYEHACYVKGEKPIPRERVINVEKLQLSTG